MKSSFDGSCAFDGSSLGNVIKPSMASLGGCALDDDEVASKPSAALENHRLSPRRRKGSAEKRRSAKRVILLCIREEEGSKSVFLLWITVRRVSSEKT
jgi:hypothetical protein